MSFIYRQNIDFLEKEDLFSKTQFGPHICLPGNVLTAVSNLSVSSVSSFGVSVLSPTDLFQGTVHAGFQVVSLQFNHNSIFSMHYYMVKF